MVTGVDFYIADYQVETICKYFDKDPEDMLDCEIAELLDEIIDSLNI